MSCNLAMLKHTTRLLGCLLLILSQSAAAVTQKHTTVFPGGEPADAAVEFYLEAPSAAAIDEADQLSLTATIVTAPQDVGRPGELFLVAIYSGAAWMKNGSGAWVPWDRRFTSLVPLRTVNGGLSATIPVTVVKGLHGLPGDFRVYLGYRNADDQLLYTANPFAFSVQRDFSRAEPDEALSAGAATVFNTTKDAFSLPTANLSLLGRQDFSVGNSFFRNPWVTAPSTTTARDGLGPLFNTNACQNCHIKDGRGHPPDNSQDTAISLLMRLSVPEQTAQDASVRAKLGVVPEPNYGDQLQDFSIAGLLPEGQIDIAYQTISVALDDGATVELRKPTYHITQLNYGPLAPGVMLSPRIAPPMIGLGLLEAIPSTRILSRADPHDIDHDGISGRANRVWDAEKAKTEIGRFGWKAGVPSVRQQSAAAFNGDMGLTTSMFGVDGCTDIQADCRLAPDGGDSEVSDEILDFVVFYASNLAVPARRNVDHAAVLHGKQLFYEAQCAACHTPEQRTGKSENFPELAYQTIHPYTDLLLHDMGEGLADDRPDFLANGREWRTPPLWGIGLTEAVSGHSYFLHDGRARNLLEAILWHDGEAAFAKQYVLSLNEEQRNVLLMFLESL